MSKINICICTYKRPKLLANCLQSLAGIVISSGTKVTMIRSRSAETFVTG